MQTENKNFVSKMGLPKVKGFAQRHTCSRACLSTGMGCVRGTGSGNRGQIVSFRRLSVETVSEHMGDVGYGEVCTRTQNTHTHTHTQQTISVFRQSPILYFSCALPPR